MRTITLHLEMPNLTFLFTATSDNAPLFNSSSKVNREVVENKRKEIYGQGQQLTTRRAVTNIPSIESCLLNWRGNNGAK